jgi:hypothetical protein
MDHSRWLKGEIEKISDLPEKDRNQIDVAIASDVLFVPEYQF